MISRFSLLCLTLIAAGPTFAGSVKTPDCESEIDKVDISDAEGQQRLDVMNTAINVCAAQYKRDKKIASLVRECAKYEDQPTVQQQFVAACQVAAFKYANALYGKRNETNPRISGQDADICRHCAARWLACDRRHGISTVVRLEPECRL